MREYVTITKDPRTDLVLAIGGTDKAADILQRTDGFLSAAAGAYDGFPHGLPIEQQQLRATTASHSLRAAGHSVHLDPALNTLSTPNGERDAALRYLAQLGERVAAAESGSEVAGGADEIVAPVTGLLPLTREVVVHARDPPRPQPRRPHCTNGGLHTAESHPAPGLPPPLNPAPAPSRAGPPRNP
ncbi:hypothetical protein ACWD04_33150 [Streptomyces sp. NPDC002911]